METTIWMCIKIPFNLFSEQSDNLNYFGYGSTSPRLQSLLVKIKKELNKSDRYFIFNVGFYLFASPVIRVYRYWDKVFKVLGP